MSLGALRERVKTSRDAAGKYAEEAVRALTEGARFHLRGRVLALRSTETPERLDDRHDDAVGRQHINLAADLAFIKNRLVGYLVILQVSIHAAVDEEAS